MRVRVFSDPDAAAVGAAEAIAAILGESGAPSTNIGLAGGTTPKATYERLREQEVDWRRVDAWLSDERWVPKDHQESNGRLALEALLSGLPVRFHRPRWAPWLTADDSAAHYEAELRELLPDGSPDLVLLGMGTDGHVASLFPDTEALDEDRRWFVANWVPSLQTWRLTSTFKLLHSARRLAFLVCGHEKAAALAQVLEGDADLPARRAMEGAADVVWFLDEEAASQLAATSLERA